MCNCPSRHPKTKKDGMHPPKKKRAGLATLQKKGQATPWWGCRARVHVVRSTASGGAVVPMVGGPWWLVRVCVPVGQCSPKKRGRTRPEKEGWTHRPTHAHPHASKAHMGCGVCECACVAMGGVGECVGVWVCGGVRDREGGGGSAESELPNKRRAGRTVGRHTPTPHTTLAV